MPGPRTGDTFRYLGFEFDPVGSVLSCRYALHGNEGADVEFVERISFDAALPADPTRAMQAFRLVYLLAGISYYKAGCPPVIDLGADPLTERERVLLHAFYVDGLGELSFRNDIDLAALRIEAPVARRAPAGPGPRREAPVQSLVPFGGGIDSIVSVEAIRAVAPDARLFVLNDFPAIEASIATTGLAVARATRRIDPRLFELNAQGAINGHVPITGVLSAIAVASAVLHGADEVVMSNEWSASQANVEWHGRAINHQWSKSLAFESAFRAVLAESLDDAVDYFSLLRPLTSLRIAQRFARLDAYFPTFRSCNRAFHIAPEARRVEWCGECDKCCFVDLILSPYVPAETLETIFGGREPLRRADLTPQFDALLALGRDRKPFECVGDEHECRAAASLAAQRPDRAGQPVLADLAARALLAQPTLPDDIPALLQPIGPHHIPPHHAATIDLG